MASSAPSHTTPFTLQNRKTGVATVWVILDKRINHLHQRHMPATAWTEVFDEILKPKIPVSKLWSIAELRLSQQAYVKLIDAFGTLNGRDWEIAQYHSQESRNHSGLFLVAVLSEHARRHTRGDQIWSCMKSLPMTNGLRQSFFLSNGQPSRQLKDAVESAAYRWNLRHVFDVPGHMSWFLTLFLQFGFPFPAAKLRMPYWLSGHALAVSTSYLLGGGMMSDSFARTWSALRAYRRNQITEVRCKDLLVLSPWILQEWIPELLQLARTRLDLLDNDRVVEGEEMDPLILSDPRLVWSADEEPFFRCEVLAATTFELGEACYEIRSKQFEPVRIVRQEEGVYHVVGGGSVDIPLKVPEVQCSLISLSAGVGEEEIATQSVTLWDRSYPITLLRKDKGRRMPDPERPERLNEGCFAIFHDTFSITPQPVRALSHKHWWIAELPACQEDEPALIQNGERVWWPEETAERIQREAFPISIEPRPYQVLQWAAPDTPPSVAFVVGLPGGAEMRWVRLGHEVVDFEAAKPGDYRTTPFYLRPEHAVYPFYATVGFSVGGKCHRVTQRLILDLQACFLERENKISIYEPHRALNVRNARQFLFHILTPKPMLADDDNRPYWIQEGSRPIKSLGTGAVSLTDLSGYGEPLCLHRGLYNSQHDPRVLVKQVRDNGAVKQVRFNNQGFRIETASPIELDAKHELIAWTMDHRFLRLAFNCLEPQEEPGAWFCNLTEFQDSLGRIPFIKAIGFFYDGCRIGNWFDRTYHFAITQIKTDENAARCAEMLRWFKVPILDPEVSSAMQFLLQRFPGDVVPVWLGSGQSPELALAELHENDEWLRVVSALLRSISLAKLKLNEAAQIIEEVFPEFDPGDLMESLPDALGRLEGVSASLISKIAHLYLSELQQGGFAGDFEATKWAIQNRFLVREEELSQFCEKLSIHPDFVKGVFDRMVECPHELTKRDEHNCDLLLNHRLMRRLLTHRYLSCL